MDKVDESGWTALHIAGKIFCVCKHSAVMNSCSPVSAGNEDIVRELVGAGADVNRKNDKGITPLSVMFPLAITLVSSDWSYSDTTQHQSPALTYVGVDAVNVCICAHA